MIPIKADTPKDKTTEDTVIEAWRTPVAEIIMAIRQPKIIPTAPPINVSTIDSTKNCNLISRFLAPIAFL